MGALPPPLGGSTELGLLALGRLASRGLAGREREPLSAQEGDLRELGSTGLRSRPPGSHGSASEHTENTPRVFVESSAPNVELKGTCRMWIFLPSLPEKFSSALQPETLLDLLQIEGMKIEEESEVRWPSLCLLPWWGGSGPRAGALWSER